MSMMFQTFGAITVFVLLLHPSQRHLCTAIRIQEFVTSNLWMRQIPPDDKDEESEDDYVDDDMTLDRPITGESVNKFGAMKMSGSTTQMNKISVSERTESTIQNMTALVTSKASVPTERKNPKFFPRIMTDLTEQTNAAAAQISSQKVDNEQTTENLAEGTTQIITENISQTTIESSTRTETEEITQTASEGITSTTVNNVSARSVVLTPRNLPVIIRDGWKEINATVDCSEGNLSCEKCKALSAYCHYNFKKKQCIYSNTTHASPHYECSERWFPESENRPFYATLSILLFLSIAVAVVIAAIIGYRKFTSGALPKEEVNRIRRRSLGLIRAKQQM
ncbi:uncharacterized protein LOC118190466 [Stegodyphus dumicola]|uniref:uncharacterized protein LOC118190466 n=1 Tax=Stegodyphus dumicola TaxID=202533 RepID=UPI0015AAD959|nr:uncharacterized protein LOC118190466 [Stegodyphus dumicola]